MGMCGDSHEDRLETAASNSEYVLNQILDSLEKKNQWEYRFLSVNVIEADEAFNHQLTELGKEGWELATSVTAPSAWCFVFKRQIET